MRLVTPENDWSPLLALDPGEPVLTVAVIIPVYNRVDLLRRTLAGLAAQEGYPPDLWSVTVADDGSAEDVAAVTGSFSLPITVLRQEHDGYGAGRARNMGAAAATADVLLFLDADCLPSPGLVAAHAGWHHRADNVVVVGARHHLDSTDLDPEAIAAGAAELQPRADRTDWRDVLHRRTAGLRHGTEAFRSVISNNLSVRRAVFEEVGGFSEDFTSWGGEDTELGWRLFQAGCLVVPDPVAAMYHQDQEESYSEEGWRAAHRRRSDPLIVTKVPHRFYRHPAETGPFEVPKVSVVVHPPAWRRTAELVGQLHDQTMEDWEVWLPGDTIEGDRIRSLPDDTGTDEQRFLRATERATGEYLAIVSGAAGLAPRLLEAVVERLDRTPRAGRATIGVSATDPAAAEAAWAANPLPAVTVVRRRDWVKATGAGDLSKLWASVAALARPVHVDLPFVHLPDPAPDVPTAVPAPRIGLPLAESAAAGRGRLGRWQRRLLRMGPVGRWVHRVARRLGGRGAPIVHLGDELSRRAIADAWHGSDQLLVVGGGARLDTSTLRRVTELDTPRSERAVIGATADDADPAWAPFLGSCAFVGVATEDDAATVAGWGVPDVVVTGHPADADLEEITARILEVVA